jgi:hypothetical protein
MGGHPYWYFVTYEDSAQSALDKLREREFKAGRYNPVIPFLEFDEPEFSQQQPGAKHRSIAAAMDASAEDGTRSILDLGKVGKASDYGVAGLVPAAKLKQLFGTDQPTREQVQSNHELFEDIQRGQGIYFTVYRGGAPAELFFAGYSYD